MPTTRRGNLRVDLLFLEELKEFLTTRPGESHQESPEQFVEDVDVYSDHLCRLSEHDLMAMATLIVQIVSKDDELYVITRDSGEVEVGFADNKPVADLATANPHRSSKAKAQAVPSLVFLSS